MIELRNLSQRFPGPRGWIEALHNVNLSIPRGEVFGIIGRSGAGKSTLVRTINLLTRPTEGNVVIEVADSEYRVDPYSLDNKPYLLE